MQVEAILRSAPNDGAQARLTERLRRAVSSGKRMEKLINQLLDVTRITAGRLRLEPEPCDLVELEI
jgi:signal transduction histidine kinase